MEELMSGKRKLYKRKLAPVHFEKWQAANNHKHEFEEIRRRVTVTSYILADRCTIKDCNYEVAKDLIVERPEGEVQ